MKSISKIGFVAALVLTLALVGGMSVQAQSEDDSITAQLQQQIQELQERVAQLQERVRSLRGESTDDSDDDDSDEAAAFGQRMRMGDRGERVQRLQEFLAQDRSIYPEGLTTGYYGRLTSQAVARLQGQIGVESDGEFDDETMARIKSMIEDGAGNSGVTPPGLLRAPGIHRLFGGDVSTTTDSNDDSDDGDDEEVDDKSSRRGPDIDSLSIPEELKDRLRGIFNRNSDRDTDDYLAEDDKVE